MFVTYGIDKLLKERNLWSSLTQVFPYNQHVVREFYTNLSDSCGNPESAKLRKVYIRGKLYSFTPELLNGLFELSSVDIPYWNMEG